EFINQIIYKIVEEYKKSNNIINKYLSKEINNHQLIIFNLEDENMAKILEYICIELIGLAECCARKYRSSKIELHDIIVGISNNNIMNNIFIELGCNKILKIDKLPDIRQKEKMNDLINILRTSGIDIKGKYQKKTLVL